MQLDFFAQVPETRTAPKARKPEPTRKKLLEEATATRQATHAAVPPRLQKARAIRFPGKPHDAAFELAEAVARAWYKAAGNHRFDIAIGAVAGVALWPLKGRHVAPLVADWWRSLNETDTLTALEECFARWWIARPDLIECARPVHEWLTDADTRTKFALPVRAAIHAALDTGLLDLHGDDDPNYSSAADTLGFLLTNFRTTGQRDALAEFHTPPEVAEMMARFTLEGQPIKPGMSFDDPCAGTGGMHRALVQILLEHNLTPADFAWSMTDIDPLAAACCALNAILWNLGPNVLVWCGDTLAEGNGPQRAAERRLKVIQHRDQQVRLAKMHVLMRTAHTQAA
ncbi:N-6 DNA methylase [Kitasatospora sp. NPDC002227]|uniref:N-6 DNA methylase n=1 Tax=Kitasatospora sp. NPDC002227 TaxID=3154773 RepID=UPI003326660F